MENPLEDQKNEAEALPQMDFFAYLSSLAFQAMVFLGEIPSPTSNKIEANLVQAKLLIDTLLLLRDKTKGNLTKPEEDLLAMSIYELQLKFVEASQGRPQAEEKKE